MSASTRLNELTTVQFWNKSDPASCEDWKNRDGSSCMKVPDTFIALVHETPDNEGTARIRFVFSIPEAKQFVEFAADCMKRAACTQHETVIDQALVTWNPNTRQFVIELRSDVISLSDVEAIEFINFCDFHTNVAVFRVTASDKLKELLKVQSEVRQLYMQVGMKQKRSKELQAELAALIEDPIDVAILDGYLLKRKQRGSKQIVITPIEALKIQ